MKDEVESFTFILITDYCLGKKNISISESKIVWRII